MVLEWCWPVAVPSSWPWTGLFCALTRPWGVLGFYLGGLIDLATELAVGWLRTSRTWQWHNRTAPRKFWGKKKKGAWESLLLSPDNCSFPHISLTSLTQLRLTHACQQHAHPEQRENNSLQIDEQSLSQVTRALPWPGSRRLESEAQWCSPHAVSSLTLQELHFSPSYSW